MRAIKRVSSPIWRTLRNNAAISTDYDMEDGAEFVTLIHFGTATDITLVQIDGSTVLFPSVQPNTNVPSGRYIGIKAQSGLTNVRIGVVS